MEMSMPDSGKTPVSMPLSSPEPMNEKMPATVRKRLIVEGNVQGVGYRALVTVNARGLKVKGYVKNLPDETVEIVCEGEPAALPEFIKSIDRKGDPADRTSLHVASIKEGSPAPEGELKRFHTDYGRELTDLERESYEREEMVVYRGGILNSNVNVVGHKVDGVGKAVEGVGQKVDSVGSAVRDMHKDMNTRFDHMARHYDMIAMSLKEAIDHMDRNAEKTDKAIEKSRKETIIEVQKSQKEIAKILADNHKETTTELTKARKESAASNRELAKAVKFMIKKLSEKPMGQRPRKTRK
jgi:acylphosphatase